MYGAVPPDTVVVIEPSQIPEQLAGVAVVDVFNGNGSVRVTAAVSEHPLASMTVAVYVRAQSPVADKEVCAAGSSQVIVYGEVPPVAVIVADPSQTPLQLGFVLALSETTSNGGAVMLSLAVVIHPVASTTVTVNKPSANPVAVVVV